MAGIPRELDIVNLDGRLAVVWARAHRQDRPFITIHYRATRERIEDLYRADFIIGRRFGSYHDTQIATPAGILRWAWQDWPLEARDVPVQRPKDGRIYTWVWQPSTGLYGTQRGGHYRDGWTRVDWPSCPYCPLSLTREIDGKRVTYDSRHDPSWVYDEGCGFCHAAPSCNGKGICANG